MSVELLSRLQFAAATMFHFLFVPLTLGLSLLIAYMETKYVKTGEEIYLKMTKFWGKLFLINFALGIVTGITLEFQFGTNWSRYSAYVGDVFGSLLAIEASVAFFLESTLIGVWVFGWNKISKKAHAIVMWLIAIAGTFSAIWIIAANAWMQHPVGYTIRNGRAELTDFVAIITQKFAILEFLQLDRGRIKTVNVAPEVYNETLAFSLTAKPGDIIGPVLDSRYRPGFFAVGALSEQELEEKAKNVRKGITVEYE